MTSARSINTPFDCHICYYAYVDIIMNGDKFYCKCRRCERKTKMCDTPFIAASTYKNITKEQG